MNAMNRPKSLEGNLSFIGKQHVSFYYYFQYKQLVSSKTVNDICLFFTEYFFRTFNSTLKYFLFEKFCTFKDIVFRICDFYDP